MDDLHKPWYARSSFSAAALGTIGCLLALRRVGWAGVPDELILSTAGLWLNFLAFIRWSPSDKTL
jgi:hypothetical protein